MAIIYFVRTALSVEEEVYAYTYQNIIKQNAELILKTIISNAYGCGCVLPVCPDLLVV